MKKIIIITGDPNSINSELIVKAWSKLNTTIRKKICFIGSYDLIQKQLKKLKYKNKLVRLNNINAKINCRKINIFNVDLKFKNPFNVSKINSTKFVRNSLNLAHKLSQNKIIGGFINCPISKNLLPSKKGVTEYLAFKCNIKNNSEVMLIKNKNLSVTPITTHIKISKISNKIKPDLIKRKIFTMNNWFKKYYKKKPKIAILGLNPHNAELSKDSEEYKIIYPTIIYLKKKRINVKGPFVADTIFINDYKKFDIIVGMYHDQVLAPFKTLFKFKAINITLGLHYLRASPDHGVAQNIIGKFKADPTSLLECIYFFNSLKK